MTTKAQYWIFSNHWSGRYGDSDWEMDTILKTKRYYFKINERNRAKVKNGDFVIFRVYGSGYWGTCQIASDWVLDAEAEQKHNCKAGWFEISDVKKWKATLPYELIRTELTNQNHRLRIAKATVEDKNKIELALKIYRNMGYGSTDGNFFILEKRLLQNE